MKFVTPEIKTCETGDVINITEKIDLPNDIIMKRGQYLVIETESKSDFTKVTTVKYGNHAIVPITDNVTKYVFYQGDKDVPEGSKDLVHVFNDTMVVGKMNKRVSVTFEE